MVGVALRDRRSNEEMDKERKVAKILEKVREM